jgi:hypothetical protein
VPASGRPRLIVLFGLLLLLALAWQKRGEPDRVEPRASSIVEEGTSTTQAAAPRSTTSATAATTTSVVGPTTTTPSTAVAVSPVTVAPVPTTRPTATTSTTAKNASVPTAPTTQASTPTTSVPRATTTTPPDEVACPSGSVSWSAGAEPTNSPSDPQQWTVRVSGTVMNGTERSIVVRSVTVNLRGGSSASASAADPTLGAGQRTAFSGTTTVHQEEPPYATSAQASWRFADPAIANACPR